MAKITTMFLCLSLLVLIAMPTSSWSRMILGEDQEVVNKFSNVLTSRARQLKCLCYAEPVECPPLECPSGRLYTVCCEYCPRCSPV
ncbi:hypothetical protein MKW94_014515 [Papaver nudicaule]|uniref:Uncharacterized protein n=1 Tax=Papaver nudicaule TaxID=74823 RepID=A0AA41RWW2_PAPNU|nr:hypothetical protein [Papaver nudicaule]